MFRRTPASVIPVPDRRRGRRILTLRNFRNALLGALALLIVINIYSEIRKPREGDYGRIVKRALPGESAAKPLEVVRETPAVDEQYGADPMLLEPAARAQYLGDTRIEPVYPDGAPAAAGMITTSETVAPLEKSRAVIVGGPEGVSVVEEQKRALPKLGGGFGRE